MQKKLGKIFRNDLTVRPTDLTGMMMDSGFGGFGRAYFPLGSPGRFSGQEIIVMYQREQQNEENQ